MKPVYVIGHKNPDTDAICAAIGYAALKQQLTGETYIPCRAGEMNAETKYVLEKFGFQAPKYLRSLKPRITDVPYRQVEGIRQDASLKQAWQYMRDKNVRTVPVVDEAQKLEGILTLGDIARFNMEDRNGNALAEAKTTYCSIAETICGKVLVGDPEACFEQGKVSIATVKPELMEEHMEAHDMIILGNRYENQLCAIEMQAACIIVGLNAPVSRTIQKRAEEMGCTVISTPLDSFTCARTINQAVPVRHIMRREGMTTFHLDAYVSDVKKIVTKKRVRYFPVLDEKERCIGVISQRNLLDTERQKVILVDHNGKDQAVQGIQAAKILEIIDHHRINAIETGSPIYFRNQPVGCTSTIIAMMYQEMHMRIEPDMAGLLCSAIITSTLLFRSPACTEVDRQMAEMLAECAGMKLEELASAIFEAGSEIIEHSPDEIFYKDFRSYKVNRRSFIVSQVTSVSAEELKELKERMLPYMQELLPRSGQDMLFLMLTNIVEESTELLFVGNQVENVVQLAFSRDARHGSVVLHGVVSRKEQVVECLTRALGTAL